MTEPARRDAVDQGASRLVDRPRSGRPHTVRRRVRLGDVTPAGRARLDALARYLQDVAADDARVSGFDDSVGWLVRRTLIRVDVFPAFEEQVELTTWCSGVGQRWAERRTSLTGSHGAVVEAASVWVAVDAKTGRPTRLGPGFDAAFGGTAAGRQVSARLSHPPAPGDGRGRPWPLRATDLDLYDHVNNAICWAAVEDEARSRTEERDPLGTVPLTADVEYHGEMAAGDDVAVVSWQDDEGWRLWLCAGGRRLASGHIRPGPSGLGHIRPGRGSD